MFVFMLTHWTSANITRICRWSCSKNPRCSNKGPRTVCQVLDDNWLYDQWWLMAVCLAWVKNWAWKRGIHPLYTTNNNQQFQIYSNRLLSNDVDNQTNITQHIDLGTDLAKVLETRATGSDCVWDLLFATIPELTLSMILVECLGDLVATLKLIWWRT